MLREDIEKIDKYLDLLGLISLEDKEIELIDELYPDSTVNCWLWNVIASLIKIRQKNDDCIRVNEEILSQLAGKDGCSISISNPDNSKIILRYIP